MFSAHLVQENGLEDRGFAGWVFSPDMVFRSTDKWWGDGGRRDRPHEGIDLFLYQDREGGIHRLAAGVRIPAMYDGTVVRLSVDFLGRSVMMEHDLPGRGKLYTMYGHTDPRDGLEIGQVVQEGDVVACLAPLPRPNARILPHLHISLGWAPDAVPYDRLDWDRIPAILTLLDPLQLLDRSTRMLEPALGISSLRALIAAVPFHSGRSDISTHHDDHLAEANDT